MVHHLIGDARQRKEVACLLSKEVLLGSGRTVRSIRCPQGREYAMGVLRLCVLGTPVASSLPSCGLTVSLTTLARPCETPWRCCAPCSQTPTPPLRRTPTLCKRATCLAWTR